MEHRYWTYIVASLSGTLYIGMTNNIERRMWEHKSGALRALLPSAAACGWCTTKVLMMFVRQLIGRSSLRGGVGRRRLLSFSYEIRDGRTWLKSGDGRSRLLGRQF